ncbi:MAG TPA: DNA polymerase I, partial [Nitrospiraceae bacterium]|nr:DNA polymerase I [Nitrospiraceae bacterium]
MPTLYLIDGNSYIYRAFYAIKGLTNSKGFPTNAIYGFTNMLLKIQREKQPDFIAVAFDSPVPTKRHIVYEAYKAQRPKMPDELRQQIPCIKEIITALKIPTIELEGLEADDILGSIAKKAESEDIETYIVTSDKDTYQLLSPMVKVYDSMRDKVIGEKEIIERFGIEPERIPEIMALMGDAIDNIPGVPGIGEKTAVTLLKEFGSLDKIIKDHLKITQPKLRASVSENIENIKLSLALATLDTNVPVEKSIRELTSKEPDWTELLRLFREFEFGSLLKLIPEQQTTEKYRTILDKRHLRDVINNIKAEIVINTETTGKDPMRASLVGISLSTDGSECYIPVGHSYSGAPEQLQKGDVLEELKAILENPEIKK